MSANTLLLRLEGPLQAWGDQESKFVIRRTAEAPTKSGVIGFLCAAMGISRPAARDWLPRLAGLGMGVRIDSPGVRWWDYHTVGAEMEMRTAEGKSKPGAMLTRREYLCDASFLVALQGDGELIAQLSAAMKNPKWALYLGRKSCPMSLPPLVGEPAEHADLLSALAAVPYRKRLDQDAAPASVDCLLDWIATPEQPVAPADALVWYDVPLSFDPPAHQARFVVGVRLDVGEGGQIQVGQPLQRRTPPPPRPRADCANTEYRKRREQRLEADEHLCVFCKALGTTVQHITYRHAGGDERQEDLRALCRLCHDAITMLEYGYGMGMDRINPEDTEWRDRIIQKRKDIIEFRSLEARRRRLEPKDVE